MQITKPTKAEVMRELKDYVFITFEGIRNRMSRLRDRATTLEIQINSELFDSAHVIASTLVSSNHRLLNGRRFGKAKSKKTFNISAIVASALNNSLFIKDQ